MDTWLNAADDVSITNRQKEIHAREETLLSFGSPNWLTSA